MSLFSFLSDHACPSLHAAPAPRTVRSKFLFFKTPGLRHFVMLVRADWGSERVIDWLIDWFRNWLVWYCEILQIWITLSGPSRLVTKARVDVPGLSLKSIEWGGRLEAQTGLDAAVLRHNPGMDCRNENENPPLELMVSAWRATSLGDSFREVTHLVVM